MLYDKYATVWNANGGAAARAAFQTSTLYDFINEQIWFTMNPNDPDTGTKRNAIKNEQESQLKHAASFDTFFFKYQRDVIGHEGNLAYKVDDNKKIDNLYNRLPTALALLRPVRC